jgi:hypothetical protein
MRVAASSFASPPVDPSSIGVKPSTASASASARDGWTRTLGVLEEQLRMTLSPLGDRRQR